MTADRRRAARRSSSRNIYKNCRHKIFNVKISLNSLRLLAIGKGSNKGYLLHQGKKYSEILSYVIPHVFEHVEKPSLLSFEIAVQASLVETVV